MPVPASAVVVSAALRTVPVAAKLSWPGSVVGRSTTQVTGVPASVIWPVMVRVLTVPVPADDGVQDSMGLPFTSVSGSCPMRAIVSGPSGTRPVQANWGSPFAVICTGPPICVPDWSGWLVAGIKSLRTATNAWNCSPARSGK